MAPNITVTKVDNSGGATLQPGDTIRYTITITNTGDMDATNTILTDVIDANTTLTNGTLDVTPIARNDSYTVDVGAELMTGAGGGVLNPNDVDPDGGSLSVSAVQGSSGSVNNQATTDQGGTITMSANGGFNYIPPAGFSGTDTFEYTVVDDEGDTDTAIVSIVVGQINDDPVARDDTASTDEDTAVMGNVLDGSNGGLDNDVDFDDLTVINNTDPSNGMVTISGDGNFTYTPDPDFNGADSFTYTISDGNGGMDTATVNITVNAVNDAPENTVPGDQMTDDATSLTLNTIQVNDVDAGSGTVESTLTVDFGTLTVAAGSGATITGDGSDTVTITGTLTQVNAALNGLEYDPAGTSGNATITLTTDDQGNTGSGGAMSDTDAIAVTVTSTVTPPDTVDDAFDVTGNVGIDVDITGSILANDSGNTPDSISFGDTAGTATTDANGTNTITTSNGGTVLLNADGTFTYDPAAGFEGTDSFFYTLTNLGGSDTAEVTFTVDDLIWFIDDSAGGTSDGTLANPFTSVAAFNAVNDGTGDNPATGDNIFLASGTYATTTTLLDDQTLIGQGTTGILETAIGITLPTFSNALPTLGGTNPVMSGTLALATNNTVSGLTVTGDITGTNVGTTTVSEVTASRIDLTVNTGTADIDVFDSTFNGADVDGLLDLNTSGSADVRIDVVKNTFNSGSSQSTGIEFVLANSSQVDFNIIGNDIDVNTGNGVEFVATGSPTLEGRVNNNTIDINSGGGSGIAFTATAVGSVNPTAILEIDGNTISAVDGNSEGGIRLRSGRGTFDATVNNNIIDITSNIATGFFIESITGGDAVMTLNVTNNDVDEIGSQNVAYAFGESAGTLQVEGFTSDLATTLAANGNTLNGATVGAGSVVSLGTLSGGTAEVVDITNPLMVTSLPTETTDVSLSATDLESIADAALERWVQTGLSDSQIETLESLTFEVTDLPDWHIGAATGTHIQIDTNAFGWGWFIDSTPLEDSEFSTVLSPHYAQANATSPAFGQVDLLTTVMHEMGHALGLPDLRAVGTSDALMNATLTPSTRRTPTLGLANSVIPPSARTTDYLTSPLDLGTLNEDQVVTIEFEVTVNDPLPAGITTVTNTATVTADDSINEMAAVSTAVECFLTGTRILTDAGEQTVETLKIGDLVQTTDGTLEPIKWIGRQTREPNQVHNPLRSHPIWVKAGALGNGLPHRDLYVSPDHALLVEGLLINAGALVNGTSIMKTEPTETFTYYHIELDKHALLVAEGTAAESYLPQKEDRLAYDNGAEYDELYPHDCKIILWPLDYPRVSSYVTVPRYIRKRLKQIAMQLGLMAEVA